jgi:hypothetical protein
MLKVGAESDDHRVVSMINEMITELFPSTQQTNLPNTADTAIIKDSCDSAVNDNYADYADFARTLCSRHINILQPAITAARACQWVLELMPVPPQEMQACFMMWRSVLTSFMHDSKTWGRISLCMTPKHGGESPYA